MSFREILLSVIFVIAGVSMVLNLVSWIYAAVAGPAQAADVFFYQAYGCFIAWSLIGTQLDAVRAVDLLRKIAPGGDNKTAGTKSSEPRIVMRCPVCKNLTYSSHCCGTRCDRA